MSYYIQHPVDGTREGPFDLILLIKKIRNGRLRHDDIVQNQDGSGSIPAIMHPDLAEIFREVERGSETHTETNADNALDLRRLWRGGFTFLQEHHGVTIYSGLYVIASVVPGLVAWAVLPKFFAFFVSMAANVIGIFGLACLMWMILRMHRGQPADLETIKNAIKQRQGVLWRTATIIGVLSYIGFLPGGILGLFVLTFTLPALMLVMEFDMPPWEAIALSRRKIQNMGIESWAVLFAMTVIGFVGGLFIFPPVLLLPIAMHAFVVVYDDVFSDL